MHLKHKTDILAVTLLLVELLLEYVQIVGGGHGNNVVQWVPGSVDDLLVKVQAVYTDLVLFAFPPCAYFALLQDGARLAVLPGRLQSDVLPVATVKHSEEVVVGAGHHDAAEGSKSLIGDVSFDLANFSGKTTLPANSLPVDSFCCRVEIPIIALGQQKADLYNLEGIVTELASYTLLRGPY